MSLSPSSGESKLGTAELSSAIATHLVRANHIDNDDQALRLRPPPKVECFYDEKDSMPPLIDWDVFQASFEKHGRQIAQMPVNEKVHHIIDVLFALSYNLNPVQ